MTPGEECFFARVSLNLHRRHLDESQRAQVAARLANLRDGLRADYAQGAQICAPVSQAQAAELLNVSRRTVQSAATILRDGIEALQRARRNASQKPTQAPGPAKGLCG
jgi:transposase-like protein